MRNTIRKIKNISLRIRAMKQYMEGLNHHVSYEEALVELEKIFAESAYVMLLPRE